MTKGAITMLVQQYSAVLKRCRISNAIACGVFASIVSLACYSNASAMTMDAGRLDAHQDEQKIIFSGKMQDETTPQPDPSTLEDFTINNGQLNVFAKTDSGTRLSCKTLTVNGGTVVSQSNLHAGLIPAGQINNGFRTAKLIINGGTVDVAIKMGLFAPDANHECVLITGGTLTVAKLENDKSKGKITITGGSLVVEELAINESDSFRIDIKGGSWSVGKAKMQGSVASWDPDFIAAGDTSNASLGTISFESDSVDGCLNIGRNSMVTIGGTDQEELRGYVNQYQNQGHGTWGSDVTAALLLSSPQTLSSLGGLQVNGSWVFGDADVPAGEARFENKSLTVIDAQSIGTNVALSGGNTSKLTVADGARLYIVGGSADSTITVTNGFSSSSIADGGWTANLATDSPLLTATGLTKDSTTGEYIVKLSSASAENAFPGLDGELSAVLDRLIANPGLDVDSETAGVRFLSRATSNSYGLSRGTSTIESASRIAMAGAVPQMSSMASESLTDAIGNRMNIANGYNAIQEQKSASGITLWITPLWKNQSGWGMEACKLNYGFNANIGGVALGADYSFSETLKAGLAFNIGGGYAESNGDFAKTKNNMNFWGIGVYGGYNDGRLSVMGDASYTSTYNKLEQDLDSGMQMKNLKADVRASVWTVGIRGDYKVSFDALDITPHLGLRYMNISSQEYDIKGGGTIAKSDGIQQSFWSIPVGVTFGKDFKTSSGWSVTPSVDFTVTPRFGDLKAYESVRFTGVSGDAGLHTQTRDYVTYKGTAGIGAKYNNIGLNLNYSYEAGSCTSSHGINASFKWEF